MPRSSKSLRLSTLLLALMAAGAAHAGRNVDRDLGLASKAGDLAEMQRQLQLGADPNVAYALFAAADGGQVQATLFLLSHGADPNAWTRLALRLPRGPGASPLYVAAQHDNRELLATLKSHGADLNAVSADPNSATCSTLLIQALCDGDLTAARALVEAGADVNRRSSAGDLPFALALRAGKDNAALVELLLRHGADPDAKNPDGYSLRDMARLIPGLPALVEQVKPRPPGLLPPEDALEVEAALHYKAMCDIGEPGYAARMRADYGHWRTARADQVGQIESAPDYPQRMAETRQEFQKHRDEASGEDAQQLQESLQHVCDSLLADHFRTGAPLFAQASPSPEVQAAQAQVLTRSSVPTVTTVTTVHKSPKIIAGGAASTP